MIRRHSPLLDVLCVVMLALLVWLYYWRAISAAPADQQSFVEGDFSGQFVAFAGYQAQRLARGEVPLWNPYNLGGHPFLADTQSAVFYPPRLLSVIVLGANPDGGAIYLALQREIALHGLIAALLMYLFIRRLTPYQPYSPAGAFIAALTFAFGGFMTGYPQLQVAITEAGVWLPLALVGALEATRRNVTDYRWFGLSGMALGLSLLAGHPQTTLYLIYVWLGYLAWRVIAEGRAWYVFVIGTALFAVIGGGLAAVQVIPGWEYQQLTTRGALGFDEKGNGFPIYDFLQIVFPGLFSLWSPLYFGIAALMLVIYSAYRVRRNEIFWFVAIGIALALSLGRGSIVYDIFYNFVPGFNLFRGQERSAYVVAVGASILAGLGALDILRDTLLHPLNRRYTVIFSSIAGAAFTFSVAAFLEWLSAPAETSKDFQQVAFALLIAIIAAGLLINLATWRNKRWLRLRGQALIALIVFELFTFGRSNPNLQSVPTRARLEKPPIVQAMIQPGLYRVDGGIGLTDNYGTLWNIQDIRGISPLRLRSVDGLLKLPNQARVWEVFNVKYAAYAERAFLAPSTIIFTQKTLTGEINLHEFPDPRPMARLVSQIWVNPIDAEAYGMLSEPAYDARRSAFLPTKPAWVDGLPPLDPAANAEITDFKPERVTIRTESGTPALLATGLVYYPGWAATIDGQPAEVLRADTAFNAVFVPAGAHEVVFTFSPDSYWLGAALSALTVIVLMIGGFISIGDYSLRWGRKRAGGAAGR